MQGHASGAGLSLGLYADIIIMALEGVYRANYTHYGFTPGVGSTFILKERLGSNIAMELMYTAESMTGQQLQSRGSSTMIVPREQVLNKALKIAHSLAAKPAITLRELKTNLSSKILNVLPKVLEEEVAMHERTFTQPEVKNKIKEHFAKLEQKNKLEDRQKKKETKQMPSEVQTSSLQFQNLTAEEYSSSSQKRILPIVKDNDLDFKEIYSRLVNLLEQKFFIPKSAINPEITFQELGVDSVGAVEVMPDLNQAFGVHLDATVIYDYPSIKALTEYICQTGKNKLIAKVDNQKGSMENDTLNSETEPEEGRIEMKSKDQLTKIESKLGLKDIEKGLEDVLKEMLHLEEKHFKEKNTLRELGIDSIGAVELTAMLNQKWEISFDAINIYDYPTLKTLSEYIYKLVKEQHKDVVVCGESKHHEIKTFSSPKNGQRVHLNKQGYSSKPKLKFKERNDFEDRMLQKRKRIKCHYQMFKRIQLVK